MIFPHSLAFISIIFTLNLRLGGLSSGHIYSDVPKEPKKCSFQKNFCFFENYESKIDKTSRQGPLVFKTQCAIWAVLYRKSCWNGFSGWRLCIIAHIMKVLQRSFQVKTSVWFPLSPERVQSGTGLTQEPHLADREGYGHMSRMNCIRYR